MEFLVEGLRAVTWQQVVMYLVGFVLIYLAIKKEYEPSLLLPMGFGAILCKLTLLRGAGSDAAGWYPVQGNHSNGCFIRASTPRRRCPSCFLSVSEP